MALQEVTLDDKYDLGKSRIFVTGFQALVRMCLMQNTDQTVGYVRSYAMTNQLPPRGKDAVAAGRDFLTYFGGRLHGHYPVVERWAVENGLAFGERSLWSDKAIDRAFGKWGNIRLLRAK